MYTFGQLHCTCNYVQMYHCNFQSNMQTIKINHLIMGSKGGAMVRALATHQCGPGWNPGVNAICGLSVLLVLSLALRGFSPGTPVFPAA